MQYMDRTPRPCIRCKTKLVKPGGKTGMCVACRAADPALAQVQRDNHAMMKAEFAGWLADNFEEDPRFGPGSGYMKPKKGFRF